MKRLVLASLLMLPLPTLAIPVQWTLDGYLISNWVEEGRATGSFVYDADTGGLAFTSFAGESWYGLHFFQAGATGVETTIAFQLTGIFLSQLNIGGFAEFPCGGGDPCEMGFGSSVSKWHAWNTVPSTLTGAPSTQVDEPGAWALFGAAMALALYTRRRRMSKFGG